MSSEYRKINMNDWEIFGGGHTAESYYHKTDDTVMLKLYSAFIKKEEILWEKECSDLVKACGVNVSPVNDVVVSDDGRMGITFLRLKNKKSFSRLIADNPERLDEYAKVFAEETKKLHSLPCNKEAFPSACALAINLVKESEYLTDDQKEKLVNFYSSVEETGTCLHGDLHLGNLLSANDQLFWIDLSDFCWGNPKFDIGVMYLMMVVDKHSADDFHCSSETLEKVWKAFAYNYADLKSDEEFKQYTNSITPFCIPRILLFTKRIGKILDWMKETIETGLENI